MIIGTTFSHLFYRYLNSQNSPSDFSVIADLHFDIIRIGCYWNEIQTKSTEYNFETLKKLLEICDEKKQNVIVTVGMKAPRFPEFYIPSWTHSNDPNQSKDFALRFIEGTINSLKIYSCIKYWQVENEPLDSVWPDKRKIDIETLKKEVDLVRKLDPTRKIVITVWGNDDFEHTFHIVEGIADIIGIDLYYKQFVTETFGVCIYKEPRYSDKRIKTIIQNSKKSVWITELQAEPWEKNMDTYKSMNPKSMNAEQLQKNFLRAKNLNPEAILFWGCEYWLWKKNQGDSKLWNSASIICK